MTKDKNTRKIEHETLREMQKSLAMMKKVSISKSKVKNLWEDHIKSTERIIKMQQIIFDNEKIISESGIITH